MIEWTPVDVLTCPEIEPTVDEERTSYRYILNRDDLVLALEIWPYDSDVWLAIRLADRQECLVDLRMSGCREIRYIREAGREELYFFSFDQRSHDPSNLVGGWQLQVSPCIQVRLGHTAP
jgi:hypothetical protein